MYIGSLVFFPAMFAVFVLLGLVFSWSCDFAVFKSPHQTLPNRVNIRMRDLRSGRVTTALSYLTDRAIASNYTLSFF